jgi:hypothetical protein
MPIRILWVRARAAAEGEALFLGVLAQGSAANALQFNRIQLNPRQLSHPLWLKGFGQLMKGSDEEGFATMQVYNTAGWSQEDTTEQRVRMQLILLLYCVCFMMLLVSRFLILEM